MLEALSGPEIPEAEPTEPLVPLSLLALVCEGPHAVAPWLELARLFFGRTGWRLSVTDDGAGIVFFEFGDDLSADVLCWTNDRPPTYCLNRWLDREAEASATWEFPDTASMAAVLGGSKPAQPSRSHRLTRRFLGSRKRPVSRATSCLAKTWRAPAPRLEASKRRSAVDDPKPIRKAKGEIRGHSGMSLHEDDDPSAWHPDRDMGGKDSPASMAARMPMIASSVSGRQPLSRGSRAAIRLAPSVAIHVPSESSSHSEAFAYRMCWASVGSSSTRLQTSPAGHLSKRASLFRQPR